MPGPVPEKGDTSVSLTHIQVEVHTQKNLRRAVSVFVGPGKWLGFKLLSENTGQPLRATWELDRGLPARLVTLPVIR